jgi:hypothetical protein
MPAHKPKTTIQHKHSTMTFNHSLADLRYFGTSEVLNDGETYTNISALCNEDYRTLGEGNERALLAQVLYIRRRKDEATVYNKRSGMEGVNRSYDRIVMCRCLNSPSMTNTFAVLLGVHRNKGFFNRNLELR